MAGKRELNQRLDDFFQDCQKQAFSIVYLSLKNKPDSLDVVQNTMMAFVKYYKHKPQDQWRPLFFKVLQNKINDHFRSKSRWFHLFSQGSDEEDESSREVAGSEKETPGIQTLNDELNDQLTHAISKLPKRQKQVVVYRLWQGFSVKETAEIMKVSQGSIKTHLSRALSQLKGELGELYEV